MIKTLPKPATDRLNRACSCYFFVEKSMSPPPPARSWCVQRTERTLPKGLEVSLRGRASHDPIGRTFGAVHNFFSNKSCNVTWCIFLLLFCSVSTIFCWGAGQTSNSSASPSLIKVFVLPLLNVFFSFLPVSIAASTYFLSIFFAANCFASV